MGYRIFGQVINRVGKVADFGYYWELLGMDFVKRVVHPTEFFREYQPRGKKITI